MTIQYTALGFEPTTLRTRVSSHSHQTRAPVSLLLMSIFLFPTQIDFRAPEPRLKSREEIRKKLAFGGPDIPDSRKGKLILKRFFVIKIIL